MMTSRWESGSVEITVETMWDGSETDAEQAARHAQEVLDKLDQFPIDR